RNETQPNDLKVLGFTIVQPHLRSNDYLVPGLHECMSRKRVSRRNPFSVRYSTDLVLIIKLVRYAIALHTLQAKQGDR
ncbi:MAG: hypothetical protein O9326_23780, partial [Microcystis sp. LE19-338.1B]|nr:hypothetical protein [Microcystis sp. LE19-338.1B]